MLITPTLPWAAGVVWAKRVVDPATTAASAAITINRFFILAPSKSKNIESNSYAKSYTRHRHQSCLAFLHREKGGTHYPRPRQACWLLRRRGFGSCGCIRKRVRRIVKFNDVRGNLNLFGGIVNGDLGIINDQDEAIFLGIITNDSDHLLPNPAYGLFRVGVVVTLGVVG